MRTEDRKLLELAAKAAGWDLREYSTGVMHCDHDGSGVWMVWRPREDDGDALRLQARIKCAIEWLDSGHVAARTPCGHLQLEQGDREGLRRAIFGCAAAVGRRMA